MLDNFSSNVRCVDRPGRGAPLVEPEGVWGSQHMMEGTGDSSGGGGHGQEQEMPPPMLTAGARSDTINSHTVFANLEDVQPRNNVAYSGVSIPADIENNAGYQSYGVKRSAEEGEEEQESKRMVTVVAMTPDGQQLYTNDPFEEIALGVDAESLASHTASVITKAELDNKSQGPTVVSPVWTQPHVTVVPSHQLSAPSRSPTCSNPSVDDYPGHYMFDVIFPMHSSNTKNKYWDYSHTLKKLFIDMNKMVQVCARIICCHLHLTHHNPRSSLKLVRAFPTICSSESCQYSQMPPTAESQSRDVPTTPHPLTSPMSTLTTPTTWSGLTTTTVCMTRMPAPGDCPPGSLSAVLMSDLTRSESSSSSCVWDRMLAASTEGLSK